MLKVLSSEPTVFGFAQPPAIAHQKKLTNDTPRNDPNDEIIRATKEIQASIERAKSNRNLYIVSSFAMAIIGYLTYQNNNLSQKVHNLHDSFQRYSAPTATDLPSTNIKIDNCLQSLAFLLPRQPNKSESSYLLDILSKKIEDQIEYLCTKHQRFGVDFLNRYVAVEGPLSIFGALILQKCENSLSSIMHLLDYFPTETIKECVDLAHKVYNSVLVNKCLDILKKRNDENPDLANTRYLTDTPATILRESDPRTPAQLTYHSADSNANDPNHVIAQAALEVSKLLTFLINNSNNAKNSAPSSLAGIENLIIAKVRAQYHADFAKNEHGAHVLANDFQMLFANNATIHQVVDHIEANYNSNPELYEKLINNHPNKTDIESEIAKRKSGTLTNTNNPD